MRGGLRSGNCSAEKDKFLPKGEDEVNDYKQKFSDSDDEVSLRTNHRSDYVKQTVKTEVGDVSAGECGEDGLNVNETKSRADGEENGDDGVMKDRLKEDSRVQDVGRVLRSRTVVNNGSEKEGNKEELEEKNRNTGSDGSNSERPGNVKLELSDYYDDSEVKKNVKGKRGRTPKIQEADGSDNDDLRKKVKGKRGRPPKVQKCDQSVADHVKKNVKGKRGRPRKVQESGEFDNDKMVKKVKGKRGRPPKARDSDESDDDEARKKIRGKRGRPPKVRDDYEAQDGKRKKSKFKCRRQSKVHETDKCNGEEEEVKCDRPHYKVQDCEEADAEGRKWLKRKCGRYLKDESGDILSKRLKNKRGRPYKEQRNNRFLKHKFGKGKKVNGFRKGGRRLMQIECADAQTEDNEASSRPTLEAAMVLKLEGQIRTKSAEAKETMIRSEAKQLIRDRIVELLFAAGWTVEYRPRQGKVYNDAVYVNPEGKTHWSVTKAYKALKDNYEKGGNNSETRGCFTFTPIPEDELKILERKTQKIRSDKNKKRLKKNAKPAGLYDDIDTKKKSKRQKLHRVKLNSAGSSGGKSLKGAIKGKPSLCEQDNSVGACHKGTPIPARKHMQHKTQNRKRCALLARNSVEGAESDSDGYVLYDGKRTVLAWMIDLGTVPLNGKVQYFNHRKTREMLKGEITRDGIHCDCCDEIFSITKFEAHARSKFCYAFQNLYLECGDSFLQCVVDSWNKQEEFEHKGFHFVDFGGEDPNDDTCGICGDGGDLICCDGCPSTFHQSCLDIEKFPTGKWHCVYCSCKFCGRIDENTCQMDDNKDLATSALSICSLCEEKYHHSCSQADDAITDEPRSLSFCGKKCQKIFVRLEALLGVQHELGEGYTCTLIHRSDVASDLVCADARQKAECNAKLAVALSVMDECFLPLADHRTGVNLIHNIVYNFGSNSKRLNYSGFYTAILERDDEIICAASIRIHGNKLAEMPFIGTRHMYRRQGMCRRLLKGIESVLCSLDVEKLVIPAISELRETWTSVFGFKPIELSFKQKMKNMNLLVFPGVDMLQKPLLKHHFLEKNMIPAEGMKSDELKQHQTMDDVANNSYGKPSYVFDLNVCLEETGHHVCKMHDESFTDTTLQLPDGFSLDTSGVTSEIVNFPESTSGIKFIYQLGVTHDEIEGNGKSLVNCLGSTSDVDGKTEDICDSREQFSNACKLANKSSASEAKIENSITKLDLRSCDGASAHQSAEVKATEQQNLDILPGLKVSSENNVTHKAEATKHMFHNAKLVKYHIQQQLQVEGYISKSGERRLEGDEVRINLALCQDMSASSGDIHRASTGSSCMDLICKTSGISSGSIHQTSPTIIRSVQNVENSSCAISSGGNISSYQGNGYDTRNVVVSSKVDTGRPCTDAQRKPDFQPSVNCGLCLSADVMVGSCKTIVDVDTDSKEKSICIDENTVADGFQMKTESSKHTGLDSEVLHASVAHCNSEAFCSLNPSSGVALHCASGGSNSHGTPEP